MKAMSMPILVVVTAIIILVVALVILTIFGSGLGNIQTVTQARSQCVTLGSSTCSSVNALPPTWFAETIKVQDKDVPVSCHGLVTNYAAKTVCDNCANCHTSGYW